MALLFTNNGQSTLASGISNSATTIVVASGQGALFPNPTGGNTFRATLVRASDGAIEIVDVTARSTDTMTVTRAQEGTTGLAFLAGDRFECRITAGFLNSLHNNTDPVGVGTPDPTGSFDVSAIPFNPGTVAVSGTAVNGTGTEFLKTFAPGQSIVTTTSSGSETREINSITSDTVMTMVSPFAGTNSGASYTSTNSGAQFVVLPNGQIRVAGTTIATSASVSDWISKADTVNVTGTQQFTAFRDQTVYNQTTGTTAAINTFASGSRINVTGTGQMTNVRGINSFTTVLSTNTGNIATIVAMLAAPQVQSGAQGVITNWKGFSFNGTDASTTNTITNMIGIDIIPTKNGGVLTNYVGVLVGAKPTAATNSSLMLLGTSTIPAGNWGVHNASAADNAFAGNTRIGGITAPTVALDVTGSAKVSSLMSLTRVNTQEVQFDGGSNKRWRLISGVNGATDGNMTLQYTTDGFVANFTNAAVFGSSGNVGFGTTPAAGYNVDVFGTDAKLRVRDTGQTNGLEIYQRNSDGGSRIFAVNNNYLDLGTNNTTRLRLVASGRALLGTTTDNAIDLLQVAGSASVSTRMGVGAATTSTSALSLAASTTGVSSLNVPHGSAPTSPVNGDVWTTTAGVFTRINGATVQLNGAGGSGTLVRLATLTPTAAANVDFLSAFGSGYDSYLIVGNGLIPSGTDSLRYQLAVAGAADTAANYYTTASVSANATSTAVTNGTLSGNIGATGKGAGFVLNIRGVNSTGAKIALAHSLYEINVAGSFSQGLYGTIYTPTSTVTGIRFFWGSGATFAASGSISIYGYSNA